MTAAHIRFLQNNQAAADGAALSASSAVSGFGVDNSVDERRWKRWRTQGAFEITGSNCKLYISDGSNKTVTLTEATYTSGAALAAHIQTQLNASSSNWTCTYSTTTGKFTIGRSTTTRSVRLSQTTDAVWDTIGFIGAADFDPSTGTAADQRRNHTSEKWHVDLGAAKALSAFIAIAPSDVDFPLSDSATLTLALSNTDNFDTPDVTITLSRSDWGIVEFFDSVTYRYGQYEFSDRTNPNGPNFDFGVIYLGDYVELATRNLNNGFSRQLVDPSVRSESDGGSMYWRRRTPYWVYSSLAIEWLADDDREEFERIVSELGSTTPFFFSVDPDVVISASVEELTKYMVFDSVPVMQHLRHKYYGTEFSLREVL